MLLLASGMSRPLSLIVSVCCVGLWWQAGVALPQQVPGTILSPPSADTKPYVLVPPAAQPAVSPGEVLLVELEGRFAQAVAAGGGKAFATFFADDAVTLSNGEPAVLGRGAIAAEATWDPKAYSLTWVVQGARMGPSNDMGFTWGHYDGRSSGPNGASKVTSGRYMTVWKKLANGTWKVALDASANDAPSAGECCKVPVP